ncbi:MAG: ABC transporter ATP-binding protein [Deltaproteobacteria bacterium]|nr:ABC transporter ATP-binding protein [Deltaproteobacteria bacterium]MBI3387576.1 ABC transporter ATP-binding protein [Deltaproteobacteria bacterium]
MQSAEARAETSTGHARTPLLRFLGYVAPHRWLIAGAAGCGVFKFTLPLIFPLFLKYLTDVLLAGGAANSAHAADATNRWFDELGGVVLAYAPWLGSGASGRLTVIALVMLAVYGVLGVASYYRSYWAGQAGHRLIFDLRFALYQHIQSMSHSFFDERRSGSIVARFVSDIQLAQNFVGSALTNVWMDSASLGFVVWILFVLERRLAWVALGVIPIYVLMIRYYSPRIKAASRSVQEMIEDFSGELQEKIAGVGVVKAFGREDYEAQRFYRTSQDLFDLTMTNVQLSSGNQAATTFLTAVAPLIVVWVAGVMVLRSTLSVGTMIAFYAYLSSLYLPLQRFSELSVVISNSLAAMERIFEFFDIRPEVAETPGAPPLVRVSGRVEFRDVGFRYASRGAGRPALAHVSLSIAPGETVAIVGRSGAGKSTLVSLLPRFYDVTGGALLIDDVDIRGVTLASLRDQIGIVPQDPILFSGALRENLLYAKPDATDAELLSAARAANATEFIDELPDGYLTLIGERGMRLSGGQRQRIAIARAFLKDPPILILDEATSALDSESENLIHDALRRLMLGRTTLIIAHRLSTVINADRIVVIEDGEVREIGPHPELLARGGLYTQLYEEQFRHISDSPPRPEPEERLPAAARR